MFCNIASILIARFDEFEFTKNEQRKGKIDMNITVGG